MWINWKRFSLGALLLASLSLFLFGCSDFGGSATTVSAPVTKTISGIVQDANGQPVANATVIATDNGAVGKSALSSVSTGSQKSTTEKSVQKTLNTASTNGAGRYSFTIPQDYTNPVFLQVTFAATSLRTVVVPPGTGNQSQVMISPATECLVRYVEAINGGTFTPANITNAVTFLQQILGPDFLTTPLSSSGSATDPGALLLVKANALLSLISNPDGTPNPTAVSTLLGAGADLNSTRDNINQAITNAGYTDPGFQVPSLASLNDIAQDTQAPTFPTSAQLTATSTTSSVTLAWPAATDNVGVVAYDITRNGVKITSLATLTYTDTQLDPATTYAYAVTARDAAGNTSTPLAVSVATKANLTYAISGNITYNGAGLANVIVAVTGTGSGSVVTDSSGNYVVTGARPGSYLITPSLTGYAFTPVSTQVLVNDANVTGQNFTAVLSGSVTGVVTNPDGSVTTVITYPDGTVTVTTTYPNGTVTTQTTYPNGTVTTQTTYPTGSITGGLVFP